MLTLARYDLFLVFNKYRLTKNELCTPVYIEFNLLYTVFPHLFSLYCYRKYFNKSSPLLLRGCAGSLQVRWTCGVIMEQFEEEEEQQPSDQSDLLTGSQDQVEDEEKPSQGQEGNSGDEWDTDLETDSRLK